MEYSEREVEHSRVMSALAKPCRSNKRGFTDTDRLTAIGEELAGTGYKAALLPHAQIWRKDHNAPIDLVISAHVDMVSAIKNPWSTLDDNGYYRGTYDNQGPESALVIAMKEGLLPDNVLVAFTGEEESGRNYGANQALEYARGHGYEPVCVALDVTYDGYGDGRLFTVENLCGGKGQEGQEFLDAVGAASLAMEREGSAGSFFLVPLKKKEVPQNLDPGRISKDTGDEDEAWGYAKNGAKTFSLCMPFSGQMHSDSGGKVRQPEFEGYINALVGLSHQLTRDGKAEVVEKMAEENMALFAKNKELVDKEVEERKSRAANMTYYAYPKPGYAWGGAPKYGMSEDEWEEYLDYNASFGIYENNPLALPEYDPEEWGNDFDEYVGFVIDELAEISFEYSGAEAEMFVEDMLPFIPESFSSAFGEANVRAMLVSFFSEREGYTGGSVSLEEAYAEIDDEEEHCDYE